ncbi:MAG: DUF4878 domain-containing protein [Prevotellaceae bacterium]|nr:DUF4878 domain-containing protein [Prevotellaceae bacterium]
MKKILMGLALCFGAFIFASCGHSNTPEGVAVAFNEAIAKGDAKKVVELMYLDNDDQKEQYLELFEQAFEAQKDQLKETAGAKFKVVDTKLDDDGTTARVTIEATIKGETKKEVTDVKQDKDGNWKVDLGK